ncbi:hypothetical protein [Chryseobacterium sp. 3008163]|uniref:hypothetical protein n=1 Tax=Chryseobacterium sp. 3008163 TaxID=2478663 RepID=UPI000F0C45F1|nr:hypothetical protein [Chryseobacterium sp. 3008163]AYN02388.1 hypothetical protein EAG08_20615 [Chryseobacterium sp. 3008163]
MMKNLAEEEIIRLAKDNSPRLLSKFKTSNPDFFEKLAAIQTNLQNSELIFCIYLKLNLTTKEIATYTYVTRKQYKTEKTESEKN